MRRVHRHSRIVHHVVGNGGRHGRQPNLMQHTRAGSEQGIDTPIVSSAAHAAGENCHSG